jgi:predicted transcriptional regulator
MRSTRNNDPKLTGSMSMKERLERIERKIDILVGGIGEKNTRKRAEKTKEFNKSLDIMTLLSLPDHLRKSAMAIIKMEDAIAEDVAKETERSRAVESAYLNQLVRMGYLGRKRRGKRVYFSVEARHPSA